MYLSCALIPVIIFVACSYFNAAFPFGKKSLCVSDAFYQYPGILLEYARLIRSGNIFYSLATGLGFNFFGTITYYGMSPLNLTSLFINPDNYFSYATIMICLRFALLGLSMCFFLDKKGYRPLNVVIFSIIYALMGFTSTYFYNYIWIDSIIMLPIVIHGLDKLIDEGKTTFYILALTFTICINYYIGYMICIFCLIWFIYRYATLKERAGTIKRFLLSSLLAGMMSAVIILPSFFALLNGKASIYSSTDYSGISDTVLMIPYMFSTGSYQMYDLTYGPAIIYTSTLVIILCIFYFFNKSFSKREKIASGIVIIFFLMSLSINFLNYLWQFFQCPIWWQSRFSFTFSFFLICMACKTFENTESVKLKTKWRILICIILMGLIFLSAIYKWGSIKTTFHYVSFYLLLDVVLILTFAMLVDRKKMFPLIMIFTLIDLSMNTFNNILNLGTIDITNYETVSNLNQIVDDLNRENDNFYRMELAKNYTNNDPLYFGYNGINYFNSARNASVIKLMENLGVNVIDDCIIKLDKFDPVFTSLFNIKYLYVNEESLEYFKKTSTNIYENEFPLSLGFMVDAKIASLKLNSIDPFKNKETLLSTLSGDDRTTYISIDKSLFDRTDEEDKTIFKYEFISDGHYLIMPTIDANVTINSLNRRFTNIYYEIDKKDVVSIEFNVSGELAEQQVGLYLLDLDIYEEKIETLNRDTLKVLKEENDHILEASIEVTEPDKYLFLSLAYEEGMKIYVDGVRTEPVVLLDSLIGLPLDEGKHTITIDYIPKGLISGAIISIGGLVCWGIGIVYKKHKHYKDLTKVS